MSVIIDNMKYPASCGSCKLLRVMEDLDMGAIVRYHYCPLTGEYFPNIKVDFDFRRERLANCPLKPYPLEGSDK